LFILLYLILCLLIFIFTYIKHRTVLKINVLFSVIWIFSGLISSFGLGGLRKPGDIIHLYIFIFLITFNLIYIIFSKKNNKQQLTFFEESTEINKGLLYFMNILGWVFLAPVLFFSLSIINQYGFSDVRAIVLDEYFTGDIQRFFARTVTGAIFDATIIISMVNLALGKRDKLLISISIFNVLLFTMTYGGRFMLLKMAVSFILTTLLIKRPDFKKIKNEKWIILVIIAGLITVTQMRSGSISSFLEMFHLYYIGSFSFLDLILSYPVDFGLNGDYLFGLQTFGFLTEPIILFLKFFFNVNLDVPTYYYNIYAQNFYNIGADTVVMYNANTTALYPFMKDFGNWGIILGPTILALITLISERLTYKRQRLVYLCTFIYIATILIDSTMVYQLMTSSSGITIVLLYLFLNKKNKRKDKKRI